MSEVISQFKIGVRNTPIFLILGYYLMVGLDLVTTYIATPDLYFEDNFIIRTFNLRWGSIIFLSLLGATILVLLLLYCTNKLVRFYLENNRVANGKSIYLIGIVAFITHLTYSFFVSINNILSHIYLTGTKGSLGQFANTYIELVKATNNFYLFFKIFIFIIALFVSFIYIDLIKKKLVCKG